MQSILLLIFLTQAATLQVKTSLDTAKSGERNFLQNLSSEEENLMSHGSSYGSDGNGKNSNSPKNQREDDAWHAELIKIIEDFNNDWKNSKMNNCEAKEALKKSIEKNLVPEKVIAIVV